MFGLTGKDPASMLTDEQINKYVMRSFKKFDKDGSGELGFPEFKDCWADLELKGTEDEILTTFKSVDVDNSGVVSMEEFVKAIKGARLEELSNRVLIMALEEEFGSIENFISQSKGDYSTFKNTVQRRRMLKKKMEEDMSANTKRLISVLSELVSNPEDVPKRDEEKEQFFNTLKDTFNAFDKDGCGELQYPEYSEAWKFLGQPGRADDIKRSFDNVDVDGSGYVEWTEFAFSIMGEEALNYGNYPRYHNFFFHFTQRHAKPQTFNKKCCLRNTLDLRGYHSWHIVM